MTERWTDNRIDWGAFDTSTGYRQNNTSIAFQKIVKRVAHQYRNGKRLRQGEQRPDPFWLNFTELRFCNIASQTRLQVQIFKRKYYGAYSRKYDRPRKFRKKRLF